MNPSKNADRGVIDRLPIVPIRVKAGSGRRRTEPATRRVHWRSVPSLAEKHQRIGLFGGTFDPPHVGHLVTAVNVRHAFSLDLVILMVANVPWQKEGSRRITPAEDRLAMVEAAVAEVAGLVPGRVEIDLGGPSYTADTLERLAKEYPDAVFLHDRRR